MASINRKRTGIAIIAVMLGLLLLNSIGIFEGRANQAAETSEQKYPGEWTQLGLPELPNSKLVNVSMDEGIHFQMHVAQSSSNIGEYLEEQFSQREFDFYSPEIDEDGSWYNEFSSENLEISVTITPNPNPNFQSFVTVDIGRVVKEHRTPAGYTAIRVD